MTLVGDAEDPDLVAPPVELLHGGVVGVLVGHEEGPLGLATVRVQPILLQKLRLNQGNPTVILIFLRPNILLRNIFAIEHFGIYHFVIWHFTM